MDGLRAANEIASLFVYRMLGPDSLVPSLAVFFGEWFPYLVVVFVLVYELFMRDDGGTIRALVRIYLPPVLVLAIAELYKLAFPSPRPFAALDIAPSIIVHDPYGSFPSTHTSFFAALAVTMYFCNPHLGKWYLIAAIMIGIARIGGGVHWLGDVLAGLAFGIALGYVIEKLLFAMWKEETPRC